jgi:N-acetylglucosaminyldiphosphoundecaprenol N-acetyl-beta-D-mannosaminyltransferase
MREFNAVLNDERIVNCPDGMPIVWAGRKRGYELPRRVYGPDLMHDFCEATAKKEYRHFFYGGAPGVPEELAENLVRKFPGMQIVGMYSPPFRPLTLQEDQEATRMINDARPDVLWVGLGCPKQEKWAFAHLSTLNVPVIAAVGQAFDIYANRVGQAPAWMRNNGLEWLYRLATNPRRLWKRYLVYNSQFLLYLAAERMGFGNAGPHNG